MPILGFEGLVTVAPPHSIEAARSPTLPHPLSLVTEYLPGEIILTAFVPCFELKIADTQMKIESNK